MYGSNLGRALMSVGDDVMRYSGQEQAMRIAQMRDARERELAELRAAVQTELAQARAERADGGRGGIIGGTMSDEHMAALAGQTVPEFTAGRDFHRSGPQSEIKATVDTPGMEYLDPADRADLEASGGMKGETQRSMLGRQHADRSREGIVRSIISPQHLDAFERGRTEATARGGAFSDNPDDQERARRGQRAMKGGDRFDVKGDEKIDEFSAGGFQGQTEQGQAKSRAADALQRERDAGAGKDNRTDPNRRRSGNGSVGDLDDKTLQQALETQRKVVSDLNKDFSKGAKERRATELARLEQLQSEQDRRLGLRTGSPAPARAPAPAPAAPGGASGAPPVNLLKEGVNTRFKNGQVWTLRAGRPARVS